MSTAHRVLLARGVLIAGMLFISCGYFVVAEVWSAADELNLSWLKMMAVCLASLVTALIGSLGYQALRINRPDSLLRGEPPSGPKKPVFLGYFFGPPQSRTAKNPYFKYGFLGLILLLLAFNIVWFFMAGPGYPYDRSINVVVVTMLLLNHLSTHFDFGPRFTFPFRLFSAAFLVGGCVLVGIALFSMP